MNREAFFRELDAHFAAKLREHGATARGVDWNSDEAQLIRFRQLLRLAEGHEEFSLVDYGCGYGALAQRLAEWGYRVDYQGYDVSERMLELAEPGEGRRFVARESELEPADFVIASGLFGMRLDVAEDAWRAYVLETLDSLDRLARRGFAFNMLTVYSDADRMRTDLYYGDPCFFFDHCKRSYSRNVALLHDYELYEFTILVRK